MTRSSASLNNGVSPVYTINQILFVNTQFTMDLYLLLSLTAVQSRCKLPPSLNGSVWHPFHIVAINKPDFHTYSHVNLEMLELLYGNPWDYTDINGRRIGFEVQANS